MFFDENGTPYTPGNFLASGGVVRQQPKVTAADGVSTAAAGFFFGTSGAAPHAAAIAALVMENSNLTPSGFEQLIRATALDIEGSGFDRDSGSGILMASSAVNTTLPDGVGSPECSASTLSLSDDPNDGPQTFRACGSITAGEGTFDELTLIAYDDDSHTPGTITLQNGFSSSGPLSLRTTSR
jgi:subtilisin family serine protease